MQKPREIKSAQGTAFTRNMVKKIKTLFWPQQELYLNVFSTLQSLINLNNKIGVICIIHGVTIYTFHNAGDPSTYEGKRWGYCFEPGGGCDCEKDSLPGCPEPAPLTPWGEWSCDESSGRG